MGTPPREPEIRLEMFQRQLWGQPHSLARVFASWLLCFLLLGLLAYSEQALSRTAFAYTQVLLFNLLRPPYPERYPLHLTRSVAPFLIFCHSYFILVIASFSQNSLIQIPKKEPN